METAVIYIDDLELIYHNVENIFPKMVILIWVKSAILTEMEKKVY